MSVRVVIMFVLLGIGAGARAQSPTPLSLEQAIAQALEHNRELARTALGLRSASYGIASAQSSFRLRLQPDGRAITDQGGSTAQYGLTASRTFLPGTELSVGGQVTDQQDDGSDHTRRTALRIGVEQPLFRDFGALVQGEPITKAEQQLRRARRDLETQRGDLVVDVVESFESLIRLEKQISSDESSFRRMDKLYRLTQARERQGRASRVDTLRVELKRGQAQSRLESSRERFSFTRRDFAELLGERPDATFTLEPPPLLDIELPTPERAVATALSNRLDLAQAWQDYDDTVRGVKIAEKGLLPAISLLTYYERVNDSQSTDGFEENLWSVGLAGDTELTRASERARLGQATVSRESALETIHIRELAVTREVQQAMSAYQRARSELGIAERNFTLAVNRARLARRLFELGRGDNFSVTDAEEALNDADTRRLNARAEASVTGYRLLRKMGILVETPDDLKPGTAKTE
jgi:outer membrane protein TolC